MTTREELDQTSAAAPRRAKDRPVDIEARLREDVLEGLVVGEVARAATNVHI